MRPVRTFKEHLKENFEELLSPAVFSMPVGFLLICFIKDHINALEIFWAVVQMPKAWLIWIGASAGDALLRAMYWYRMERKPSYIRKTEEFERWLADKKAKKEAADKLKNEPPPEIKE